mmetsp:Transcript_93324/g.156831  ORF Transcript_93324/g.156831 Transcript_93324/m.156831 type:complete len:578 (+) Transcript_93324:298-2031(+)
MMEHAAGSAEDATEGDEKAAAADGATQQAPPQVDQRALNEALLRAVDDLQPSEVARLLERRADAAYEKRDEGGWGAYDARSPIHKALRENCLPIITLLLEAGAKVNAPEAHYDWRGCGGTTTAFEMAVDRAVQGNPELLRLFLKHGGNPNETCSRSIATMRTDGRMHWSVIHTAVRGRSPECVQVLLEAGANVDAEEVEKCHNERGFNRHTVQTALHIACEMTTKQSNEQSLQLVDVLLRGGADPNAIRQRTEQVEKKNYKCVTDDPREDGYVSPVRCVPVKETPLHIALRIKALSLARKLVLAGARADIPFQFGKKATPTAELCPKGRTGILYPLWTPEQHDLFPRPVQEAMRSLLLCTLPKRPLPVDLIMVLFQYLEVGAWDQHVCRDQPCEDERAHTAESSKKTPVKSKQAASRLPAAATQPEAPKSRPLTSSRRVPVKSKAPGVKGPTAAAQSAGTASPAKNAVRTTGTKPPAMKKATQKAERSSSAGAGQPASTAAHATTAASSAAATNLASATPSTKAKRAQPKKVGTAKAAAPAARVRSSTPVSNTSAPVASCRPPTDKTSIKKAPRTMA